MTKKFEEQSQRIGMSLDIIDNKLIPKPPRTGYKTYPSY